MSGKGRTISYSVFLSLEGAAAMRLGVSIFRADVSKRFLYPLGLLPRAGPQINSWQ